MPDRLHRYFKLEQHHITVFDHRCVIIDMHLINVSVCAGDDDDAVVVVCNDDVRNAGRCFFFNSNSGGIDTIIFEVFNHFCSECIISHFADDGDVCAEPCGGDRLVGTFAAEQRFKMCTGNRFTGSGYPVGHSDQVHIDAADNRNFRLTHPSHHKRQGCPGIYSKMFLYRHQLRILHFQVCLSFSADRRRSCRMSLRLSFRL